MKKAQVISLMHPLCLKGIMHRGYHDNKTVYENSLKAFEKAIETTCAIELDVHITKDNHLVVIHDEYLNRVTGKDGCVEHLTLEELNQYRLLDGQKIPTFEEVLELVHEQVPLIVELKVFEKNYKKLAAKVYEVMNKYIKDKKNYVLISFDPRSLFPLKKMGLVRLLLVAKSHEYVFNLFGHSLDGIDIEQVLLSERRMKNFHKRHFVNVWTIENEEQLNEVLPYVDTVTYQYMDPNKVKEALERK